jgi:hypothetical protein
VHRIVLCVVRTDCMDGTCLLFDAAAAKVVLVVGLHTRAFDIPL